MMSTPTFATTHNLVAFLEKSVEFEEFDQIIDFLKANPIKYALTVNPIIYSSCIKQFWATAKVQKINDQKQIQALVDKKKIIINEDSIRRDLKLDDAKGSTCLPNATIFEELARMGYEKPSQSVKTTAWNEFNSTMASFIICLANNQKFNYSKYILDHLETSKWFSGNVTPLFDTMMVQASEAVDEDLDHSADPDQTPINDQPLTSSNTQKKLKPRVKQRKEIEEPVSTSSSDPLSSGKDSFLLNELMVFYLSLQEQLLDLQDAKAAQAKEIATLKKKINKLERKRRMIEAFDADNEVTLKDNADLMFDTSVFEGDEVVANIDDVIVEPKVVTTVSGPTTTTDELTLAQTLIEIAKSKKVKAITTAATSVTTVAVTSRPKAKGIIFHDLEEQRSSSKPTFSSTKLTSKDKGKAIMIEPEKPLKKKDQVAADEEYARQVAAEIQVIAGRELVRHVEAKIDDSAELKSRLEIVPEDEDDVTVDATPLSSKSPSINFNREDLEDLWKIVKSRFKKTDPVNDMDNLLLRTLNTMFEPQVEDTVWTYQQGSTVKNWKPIMNLV
ncbi:hypothetical protein Tco_0790486 [Tanacetum coccineum]